jgi:CRISPR-associated protein Csd1
MIRRLVRTAYTGVPPPDDLLVLAVQAFRIPDPPATGEQRERQELRRMALASAMKLVLTHGQKEEAIGMQELDPRHQTSPYLCGQLLAILEEIQLRAAKWRLNTTIVDRFYGSASTAPASVFSNLLNMAAKAHIPKARKEGRLSADKEALLCDVAKGIDSAGGFKTTLKLQEQADFALGFYSQRASFMKDRLTHK